MGRELQARRSIGLDRARVDQRADGRHFVSVPYRDSDPSLVTPDGMYVAMFERIDDPASVVFLGDVAALSASDYARYLSGELPGGFDREEHVG